MKISYTIDNIKDFLETEKHIKWNKLVFDNYFKQIREVKKQDIVGKLTLICISPLDQAEFKLSIYVDDTTFYFTNSKHTTQDKNCAVVEILSTKWKNFLKNLKKDSATLETSVGEKNY